MVTGTEADGTTLNFSYTVKFDGQYSATAGAGAGDSISFRRLGHLALALEHV